MSTLLNAQDKLSEITARLAALQALFMYEERDKEFGQDECFGIDLTIQTIIDDLDEIGQSLSTVKEHKQEGESPTD